MTLKFSVLRFYNFAKQRFAQLKTEKKYHIQKMKSFGNVKVQAFAVTLESEGGNPTPKGQMYVMGKM